MSFALSLRSALGALAGGVRSGLGNWPAMTGGVTTLAAFVATAGAMETLWPKPLAPMQREEQKKPADTHPVAQNGADARSFVSSNGGRFGGSNTIGGGGSGGGSEGGGSQSSKGARAMSAAYHPDEPPSHDLPPRDPPSHDLPTRSRESMTRGEFIGAVVNGQILVPSIDEFYRLTHLPQMDSPEERAVSNEEARQKYEEATRAGGSVLELGGSHGVVVGGDIASRFGYSLPSAAAMQASINNRGMQSGQRGGSQTHMSNTAHHQVASSGFHGAGRR